MSNFIAHAISLLAINVSYIQVSMLSSVNAAEALPSDQCAARLADGVGVPEIFPARPTDATSRPQITARLGNRRVTLTRRAIVRDPIELVSFVVPVYRELRNGNIARLIRALERQGVGRTLRLIAVVNNTPDVAAQPKNPILLENRETVRYLNSARRRASFDIEVIDETRGFARNMGLLRNRGLFRAFELARVDPSRHLIVNFDADSQMPDTYVSDLIRYYDDFGLDALLSRRTLSIPDDAPRELFQSHHHSAQRHLEFELSQILLYPGEGASTPQITVRASVAMEMKGFADWEENEDLDFGERLFDHLTFLAPDLTIAQSDRVREDGFDAARGLQLIRSHLDDDEYVPGRVYLNSVARYGTHFSRNSNVALQTRVERGLLSLDEALRVADTRAGRFFLTDRLKLGSVFSDSQDFLRTAVPHLIAESNIPSKASRLPVLKSFLHGGALREADRFGVSLTTYLYSTLYDHLTPGEARRLIDQWYWRAGQVERLAENRRRDLFELIETGSIRPAPKNLIDPFRAHLRRDSSLRRDIDQQIRKLSRIARAEERLDSVPTERIVERLAQRYPDWLEIDWSLHRWVFNVEASRLIIDWVLNAMARPEDYPGTTRYLEALRPPEMP